MPFTGRGAFRSENELHELGIVQQWYDFRDASLAEIARDWLRAHEIPFIDDLGRARQARIE